MNTTEPDPLFEIRNRKASGTDDPPLDSHEVDANDEDPLREDTASPVAKATAPPAGRREPRVGLGVWAVCGLAVVAVVVAFLSWRSADNDPDRARAALRDAAVIQGTAAVETMNSIDYRDVPAGIKAWQDVSTGVLHDQLSVISPEDQELLAQRGKVATGRVVQAALTELTDRTATLIVAVEVTVTGDEDEAEEAEEAEETEEPTSAVKRNRFAADLVLVGGRWKLENLGQVAVGT